MVDRMYGLYLYEKPIIFENVLNSAHSSWINLFWKKKTPPVEALRQIGKKVNEDGQLSLNFDDRCQQEGVVKAVLTSAPQNSEVNGTIECNCSIPDDNYCHITSL
jgi:hypothetical protein